MRWRRLLPPPPCPPRQCGAAVLGIPEDPESAVAVAGQDVLLAGLWVGPDLYAPEVVAAGWGDSTDRVDVATDLDQLTVHDPDGSKPASVVGQVGQVRVGRVGGDLVHRQVTEPFGEVRVHCLGDGVGVELGQGRRGGTDGDAEQVDIAPAVKLGLHAGY